MAGAPDEPLEAALDRGWREIAVIDAAYRHGDLDRAGWHRAMRQLIEPSYLSAPDGFVGSGYSGTEAGWRQSRSLVLEAVDRDGDFLDIGCANGLLMESIHRWGRERGRRLEPFGVEISAALAGVARQRLPAWATRIWTANVADWEPHRRFDFVRTGLEYVPEDHQEALVRRLLARVVQPGGRLIIGKSNERTAVPSIADRLSSWGLRVTGSVRRPHAHPGVVYTVYGLDAG